MWLLLQSIYSDMQAARASGIKFTADQLATFNAQFQAADTSRVMSVAGNSAEIHVKGVLTNAPDIFAMWFGGGNTTYPEIISALAEADANPDVDQIVMRFDSGGGSINGMFDAIAAMQTTKKHIKAVVGGVAASAAYGLASQADELVAHNRASMVGSIGVVVDAFVDPDRISITSSNAPDKRPDLTTAEGKAVVVAQLDAIAELLDEAVAEGRSTTVGKVNANFGQGATLLADEAIKRGMIDSISKTALQSVKTTNSTTAIGGDQPEATEMDLNKLKADHPGVYAAAVQIGADQGATQEHDRVSAHLTMGNASGDMKTALKAVEDGSAMTATLQAQYMAAGMNRKDIENRQEDNADTNAADNTNEEDTETADVKASADLLAAAMANCGVEAHV